MRFILLTTFALLIPFAAQAQPQPVVLVGAHYDVARQTPMGMLVYQAPLPAKLFLNGFLEVWQNNEKGFPANEPSVFSKHWLDYPLTGRLNASLNLEVLWNRAGVDFTWPAPMQFEPGERKVFVTPKLGFTYRIL